MKFDFKFRYGKDEDTIDELIERIEEDNGSTVEKYSSFEMMYIDYIFKFEDKEFILCGYIFWSFPHIFEYIKQSKDGVFLTGASRGDLEFKYIEDMLYLKFYYDKEFMTEIRLTKREFVEPIYKELYKFITYFKENANRKIVPSAFLYVESLEKYLNENPINLYSKEVKK